MGRAPELAFDDDGYGAARRIHWMRYAETKPHTEAEWFEGYDRGPEVEDEPLARDPDTYNENRYDIYNDELYREIELSDFE